MKIWRKYVDYLMEGEWHIHTNYTDGKNTIHEYCQKAEELGIPVLAFTEHVRINLNYDFNNFLNDIEEAKDEFDIIILSGCEAKVLPDGELDVKEQILKEVDYPIFAFHSFPQNMNLYIECLKNILRNHYVNTWAHPGTFLTKNCFELSDEEIKKIFRLMEERNILYEINIKHKIIPANWINYAKKYNVGLVRGSDVHCIEEMQNINSMRNSFISSKDVI